MDPTLEDPSLEQPVEEDLLLHLPFEERVESKVSLLLLVVLLLMV